MSSYADWTTEDLLNEHAVQSMNRSAAESWGDDELELECDRILDLIDAELSLRGVA